MQQEHGSARLISTNPYKDFYKFMY